MIQLETYSRDFRISETSIDDFVLFESSFTVADLDINEALWNHDKIIHYEKLYGEVLNILKLSSWRDMSNNTSIIDQMNQLSCLFLFNDKMSKVEDKDYRPTEASWPLEYVRPFKAVTSIGMDACGGGIFFPKVSWSGGAIFGIKIWNLIVGGTLGDEERGVLKSFKISPMRPTFGQDNKILGCAIQWDNSFGWEPWKPGQKQS